MANRIVRFEVRGLRELGENFALLTEDMQKSASRAAVRSAAKLVEGQAWINAQKSRRTGQLQDAIGSLRDKGASSPGLEVWAVGVIGGQFEKTYTNNRRNRQQNRAGKKYIATGAAYYWKFVEFGTIFMEARPFLRPALDANAERATTVMKNTLHERIQRSLKKLKTVAPLGFSGAKR